MLGDLFTVASDDEIAHSCDFINSQLAGIERDLRVSAQRLELQRRSLEWHLAWPRMRGTGQKYHPYRDYSIPDAEHRAAGTSPLKSEPHPMAVPLSRRRVPPIGGWIRT